MAWTVTIEQLRDERDELCNRIGGGGMFEQLARAHRWLDCHDKAERWFRKEVADLEEVEAAGDGSARLRAWLGGLLVLAGARSEAEPWLRRTLGWRDLEPEQRAGVYYLLGEHREASLAAPGSVPAVLAHAVREGDPTPLQAGRARLVELLRSSRAGPTDVVVGYPWTKWDWIEESFIVEARLRGEDAPSHEQMLRRLGLYADPAPPAEIKLVAGARAEIVRDDELGNPVRSTISVVDDELVEVMLDPRPGSYVKVDFDRDEEGWVARLYREPDESEATWMIETETFAEAVERAGEWLAVNAEDPPGGAWTTAALSDLVAAIDRA